MTHLIPLKFTAETRGNLIRNIADYGGNITKACEEVGIQRRTFYQWMDKKGKTADRFRKLVEQAKKVGVEALEDEARRRGMDGYDKPVFFQGDECGVIREYSDTLLIFLIKGHKKMYVDRHEVTGANGKSIQYKGTQETLSVNVHVNLKDLTRGELEHLQQIAKDLTTRSIEPRND
jgi:hypothetical protein